MCKDVYNKKLLTYLYIIQNMTRALMKCKILKDIN